MRPFYEYTPPLHPNILSPLPDDSDTTKHTSCGHVWDFSVLEGLCGALDWAWTGRLRLGGAGRRVGWHTVNLAVYLGHSPRGIYVAWAAWGLIVWRLGILLVYLAADWEALSLVHLAVDWVAWNVFG